MCRLCVFIIIVFFIDKCAGYVYFIIIVFFIDKCAGYVFSL